MYNEKTLLSKLWVFGLFGGIPTFAFVMVVLVPFVIGFYLTFTDSGALVSFNLIGLYNYRHAFGDAHFWNAFGVTARYVFFTVLLTNGVAMGLALLVSSEIKGQNFFRVGFFTPNLIGGIILGYIWQFIFIRMVPFVGQALNIPFLSSSWLADPGRALWALVLVSVWQGSGYMMLIYTAGLMGIPNNLLEAADLEGATGLEKLFKIKVPLMVPSFTISLFLTIRNSFMVYDLNVALTEGGPFRSTEMMSLQIFNEAFTRRNFATAQSQAMILFAIVAMITVAQVLAMKKLEVEL